MGIFGGNSEQEETLRAALGQCESGRKKLKEALNKERERAASLERELVELKSALYEARRALLKSRQRQKKSVDRANRFKDRLNKASSLVTV